MDNKYIDALNKLSPEERQVALDILKQVAANGNSELLSTLKYSEFEEIPVDIHTFLHDRKYLGNALYDKDGRFTLFPYWEEKLADVFPDNLTTKYNTIILTGSIGIGKSTFAVICQLYMLYRLLCMKDPYLYYGMQPIDKISISLLNITIENARGVAVDKMNQMVLASEWFMAHGEMHGTTNMNYVPEKHIEFICGSSNNQIIGRALFCLDGDTIIKTTTGYAKLSDLADKSINVISIDDAGQTVISDSCTVVPTVRTNEEYQIELEDGTIIKCTAYHKFKLVNGEYKMAKDLTDTDEIAEHFTTYNEFIQNIINTRGQWNIDKNTYFEKHHIVPLCLGGKGDKANGTFNRYSKNQNCIWLYPDEHFIAHKLLALENPTNSKLVLAWSMMAFPKGKTKRNYIITADDYKKIRTMQANVMRINSEINKKPPWNKGLTKETNEKLMEISKKFKGKNTWVKGIKRTEIQKQHYSEAAKKRSLEKPETFICGTKGKVAITNGKNCYYISKDDPLPDGYSYGQGKRSTYNIKDKQALSQLRSEQCTGTKNPMYKQGNKISGSKNGHAIYIYTYNNIDYQCRDDLMQVLKLEFPTVSESTIRKIQTNNYGVRIKQKFQKIIDNLTWRLKKDED